MVVIERYTVQNKEPVVLIEIRLRADTVHMGRLINRL